MNCARLKSIMSQSTTYTWNFKDTKYEIILTILNFWPIIQTQHYWTFGLWWQISLFFLLLFVFLILSLNNLCIPHFKGTLKQFFCSSIGSYLVWLREQTREKMQKKMSENWNFVPKKCSNSNQFAHFYSGWTHISLWVDARFMVGGCMFFTAETLNYLSAKMLWIISYRSRDIHIWNCFF